jgi:hypothetical protein
MGVLMKPANSHGYAIFVLSRARARGGCVLQLPACFLLSRAHHAEYEIGRVGNSERMR